MKKLANLDVKEVSLVGRAANKKKYLVFKSRKGKQMPSKEAVEAVQADKKFLSNVEKAVKVMKMGEAPLDNKAQATLMAIARLLGPMKDKLAPEHVAAVTNEAGMKSAQEMANMEKEEGAERPGGISDDHHSQAMKAYKDELCKLGYQMYPAAKPADDVNKDADKEDDDEDDENEEGQVEKSDKVTGVDWSKVPVEQRPHLQALFKQNEVIQKQNEELREQITKRDEAEKERSFVAKAESFTHLGLATEEVVATLRDADKISKDAYERVCKQFETLNEQGRTSETFKVYGSRASNNSGAGAEAKLQALVDSVVAKSSGGKTKEQIYDEVCKSAEGKKLYVEAMKEHEKHVRAVTGGR